MEILSGEQMRRVDRRAIETLALPGLLLMESAGSGVAEALLADYPEVRSRPLLVLCGKGNNGGDALVAARHLARRGLSPRVVLAARADTLRGDARTNLQAAIGSGLTVEEAADARAWSTVRPWLDRAPLVLDGLLGTGVRGGARGLLARIIGDLNASACAVVAIDLPSGLGADAAEPEGLAVRAERTYTLCRPKPALVLEPAAALAGRWRVIPIGIPDHAVAAEVSTLHWTDAAAVRGLLPPRTAQSHKGSYGHVLVVAGSRGKSGAAVLAARGALRCGAGLVTVAAPAPCRSEIAAQQAEVMTEPLPATRSGAAARGAARATLALLEARDVLLVGPGLGLAAETRAAVLSLLARRGTPAVADADALNALARGGAAALARLRRNRAPLLLTPHPGEAARLLGWTTSRVQKRRHEAARRLARSCGAVCVLKGHHTLVADPDGRLAINSSGNPGMATGGSGDVLGGMLAALLPRGLAPFDAARLAVWLHGAAGDLAAARVGQESLTASDLLEALPDAMLSLGREEARRW